MIIRQFHRYELKSIIIAEIALILLLVITIAYKEKSDIWIFSLTFYCIFQVLLIYYLSYELRAYKICNEGIYIILFYKINIFIKWDEIIRISYEIIKINIREYDTIICTCIQLKKKNILDETYSSRYIIDYDWIFFNAYKVIAIYLDDLKPGQYEEFWSYVPERLKGNFKPKEEIVDN